MTDNRDESDATDVEDLEVPQDDSEAVEGGTTIGSATGGAGAADPQSGLPTGRRIHGSTP
jgi:hypothetical protein